MYKYDIIYEILIIEERLCSIFELYIMLVKFRCNIIIANDMNCFSDYYSIN